MTDFKAKFTIIDVDGKEHVFNETAIISLHLIDPKDPDRQLKVNSEVGIHFDNL